MWRTDVNHPALRAGRDRLLKSGLVIPIIRCDAQRLAFPDNHFDRVGVAFGLRDMPHKDAALAEMRRVLKPGGKLLVERLAAAAKTV